MIMLLAILWPYPIKKGTISLTKSRNTPLDEAHFDPVILKDYQEMDITQFNLSHKGTIKQITGFNEILEFIVGKLEDAIA